MKRVFVRSAQLDEHFYALTDGVKLYGSDGIELHESFMVMDDCADGLIVGAIKAAGLALAFIILIGFAACVSGVCNGK